MTRWAWVVLAAMLAVIALSAADMPGWTLVGALLAPLAAMLVADWIPLASLGICVLGAVAVAPAFGTSVPPWTVAFAVALGVVAFLAGRRGTPALPVFAAGAVLAVTLAIVVADVWATGLLVLALAVGFPWGIGRAIRQQAALAAATADQVHLRERTRIAHDMHDTLGHELSLLALRAGALELAPDLAERHRAAAAELRVSAAAATEVLSGIVQVLRDGEPAPLHPASDRVEDLLDRAVAAGAAVTLTWDGPRDLPPTVDRAAHRVVQEAVTNAVKHAPGSAIQVRLSVDAATTVVAVTNAVAPGTKRGPGGRQGLVALRERVRIAGGTLDAGPREHEFVVVATFPVVP